MCNNCHQKRNSHNNILPNAFWPSFHLPTGQKHILHVEEQRCGQIQTHTISLETWNQPEKSLVGRLWASLAAASYFRIGSVNWRLIRKAKHEKIRRTYLTGILGGWLSEAIIIGFLPNADDQHPNNQCSYGLGLIRKNIWIEFPMVVYWNTDFMKCNWETPIALYRSEPTILIFSKGRSCSFARFWNNA